MPSAFSVIRFRQVKEAMSQESWCQGIEYGELIDRRRYVVVNDCKFRDLRFESLVHKISQNGVSAERDFVVLCAKVYFLMCFVWFINKGGVKFVLRLLKQISAKTLEVLVISANYFSVPFVCV